MKKIIWIVIGFAALVYFGKNPEVTSNLMTKGLVNFSEFLSGLIKFG